jgi:hypothetical protein
MMVDGLRLLTESLSGFRATRRSWAGLIGIAALSLASGMACSAVKISHYDSGKRPSIQRVAVVPLIVVGATETHVKVSGSYAAGWFTESSRLAALSPAQYYPAAQAMFSHVGGALRGVEVVHPEQVDLAMEGSAISSIEEATREIAARTSSQATLVFRVRDFNSRPAGLDNARATGIADVTLYDVEGEVIWALSASINYSGVGESDTGPELVDFVDYAASELRGEIESKFAGG